MTTPCGTLYGIGVGPGDPELIPVKATRILGEVDHVFTASSTKNDFSMAVDIAGSHIPEATPIERLAFPMSRNQTEKETAWQQNAGRIAEVLRSGRCAAFLTLGDPLTYSTFGYVVRAMQENWPACPIVTIPGITSYQAAAAATNRPLVEGEESLLVLSGVNGGDRLHQMTRKPENVVFLKAYRNLPGIYQALEEAGMTAGSVAVTDCARESEAIHTDLAALATQEPNYWTLIIAKQPRTDETPQR